MAQRECPKCKKEIEEKATKCPHCQSDLRNWFAKHKIMTGILVVIVLSVIANAGKTPSKTPATNAPQTNTQKAEAPIEVTALKLYSDYEDNEVKADTIYKGKLANISGNVYSIDKVFGQTSVSLETKQYSVFNVQCFFSSDQEAKLAELKKGQKVKLQGTVDGKSLNIAVRDCSIL